MFSGFAVYNNVQLDGVHIENNNKSDISLAFKDSANGNIVIINGAVVIENTGSGGGGIFIASESDEFQFGNTIIINSTRFISNVANIGGGIAEVAKFLFFSWLYCLC